MNSNNYFIDSRVEYGELTPLERYSLYNWTVKYKPKNILEIGTGTGGSTKYLYDAIVKNGSGSIYSCDPIRSPKLEFLESRPLLYFFRTTSDVLINYCIENSIVIDFIFFDGPEDPLVAINDIKKLEKHIAHNTLFAMHDWHKGARSFDNASSSKTDLIKPYMEQSDKWKAIEVLKANEKNSTIFDDKYDSVGLCLYQYMVK